MSRRIQTNKSTHLQSLEQLILMSASAVDAESMEVNLSDIGTPESEPDVMDGELGVLQVEGNPEFLFSVAEIDPAFATGMMTEESAATDSSDGDPPLEEFMVVIGPNGELVELLPGEEIPAFEPGFANVDPAASSGVSSGNESPTELAEIDGPPEEPLLFVGPDGELVLVEPGQEIPDGLVPFEFELVEFDGEPAIRPDGIDSPSLPFEFVEGEEVPSEFLAFTTESNPAAATGGVVEPGVVEFEDELEDVTDQAEVESGNLDEEAFMTAVEDFVVFDNILPFPTSMDDGDLAVFSGASTALDTANLQATSGEVGSGATEVEGGTEDESVKDGDDADLIIPVSSNADLSDDSQDMVQTGTSTTEEAIPDFAATNTDSTSVDNQIFASASSDSANSNFSGSGAVTIQGTDASEWISGTDGDDVIAAGGGNDEIYAPIGNNVVDGGDGEDRLVIYEGNRDQYTIKSQSDGVVILEGPGLNGETVRVELSNVEWIQFNDGSIQVYSLTNNGGSNAGAGSTINGTSAGEWLAGTSADDDIQAGDGNDEIYAPLGTNLIDGGAGIDTLVVYEGMRSAYVLSKSADGRVYLEGPGLNGTTVRSLLTDVERIQFNDGTVETLDLDLLTDAALLSVFN